MAYSYWRVGVHFQPTEIVCVALQKTRFGRALRRWWQLPVPPDATESEYVIQLRRLRCELPRYHRLAVALPAAETLQKQLPIPQLSLRESEQLEWITSAIAQQLEMPAQALAFDYRETETNSYSVTAARRRDVERLEKRMAEAGLNLYTITPDACALQHFLPWLAPEQPGLRWHNGEQWLWATRSAWGCGPEPDPALLLCTTLSTPGAVFNPWFPLYQLQPPMPEKGDAFAIALALALGAD